MSDTKLPLTPASDGIFNLPLSPKERGEIERMNILVFVSFSYSKCPT